MATTEQAWPTAKIQQNKKQKGTRRILLFNCGYNRLARPGIGIKRTGFIFRLRRNAYRTDSTAHLYYILTKPHLLLYMKVRPGVVVAQRRSAALTVGCL
jgi:hypothetical protein